MKQNLFLAALASVALVGCVSNEVDEVVQKQENQVKISFDAPVMYNNAESRIVTGEIKHEGDKSYPEEEDFMVYAKEHTDDFEGWTKNTKNLWGTNTDVIRVHFNEDLNGWEPCTYDGTTYTPQDYYWQVNMKATFAAYSPADASESGTFSYSDTGLKIENFQVKKNHTEQYDLMFSKRSLNQTTSNQTWQGYSGTPIEFQHALSSVHFALVAGEGVTATLTSIKLKNIADKGTFEEGITAESTKYERGINVNPKWTLTANETADYTPYDFTNGEGVFFPTTAKLMHDLLTDKDDHAELLLLPQTFDDNSNAELEVTYSITKDEETTSKTATIPLNSTGLFDKWAMGTRYIYVLSLGGSSKIYFAPGVETWVEVQDVIIQLENFNGDVASAD